MTVIEDDANADTVRLNAISLGEVAGLMYCAAKVSREVNRSGAQNSSVMWPRVSPGSCSARNPASNSGLSTAASQVSAAAPQHQPLPQAWTQRCSRHLRSFGPMFPSRGRFLCMSQERTSA